MRELHQPVARAVLAWSMQHRLYNSERSAHQLASVIATFALRCAPQARSVELASYQLIARFLALFFHFDEELETLTIDDMARYLEQVEAVLANSQPQSARPSLTAMREFLDELAGKATIAPFVQSFRDYLGAVREEHCAAPAASERDSRYAVFERNSNTMLDHFFRLRSLLIATQPYLRCWQLIEDIWPPVELAALLTSQTPSVRQRYPHPMLDRALDLATSAHPLGATRHAPKLSELEALSIVMTYTANDIGSQAKDQKSGESNLLFALISEASEPKSEAGFNKKLANVPLSQHSANESVRNMYNIAVMRFQYLRNFLIHSYPALQPNCYVSLITDITDGNLQGTRDLALARRSQDAHYRYVADDVLKQLALIDSSAQ